MHRLKDRDGKLAPDSAGTVTNKRTVTPPSGAGQSPLHRLKDRDGKLAPDSAGTVTNKRTVTPPSGASPLPH